MEVTGRGRALAAVVFGETQCYGRLLEEDFGCPFLQGHELSWGSFLRL